MPCFTKTFCFLLLCSLETQVSDMHDELNAAKQENESLRDDVRLKRKEIESLKQNVVALSSDLAQERRRRLQKNEEHNDAIARLRRTLSKSESDAIELAREKEALENESRTLYERIEEDSATIRSQMNVIADYDSRMHQLELQTRDASRDLPQHTAEQKDDIDAPESKVTSMVEGKVNAEPEDAVDDWEAALRDEVDFMREGYEKRIRKLTEENKKLSIIAERVKRNEN